MTPDEIKAARGPLAFAATIGGAAWLVSMLLSHTTVSVPTAPMGKSVSPDPEVRLCDEQVPILLHSRDMYDLLRAQFLVKQLNCDIGKRL